MFNILAYLRTRLAQRYGFISNIIVVVVVQSECPTHCNPHGLQNARLPWPTPSPRVCRSSRPLHWWCCPTISSSDYLFSFCLPSLFPKIKIFPMSFLFASGDQNVGASATASVLPMSIQGWFPLRFTGWISAAHGTLRSLHQHHGLKASVIQCSAFFMVQLSQPYVTTERTIALIILTIHWKLKLQYFGQWWEELDPWKRPWSCKRLKDPDPAKDWRQEEKGTTEGEMVGWYHRLSGHEFE